MNFSTTAKEVGFVDGDVVLSVDGVSAPNVLDSRFMSSLISAHEVTVRRSGVVETIRLPEDMMQRLLRAEEGFGSLRMPFIVGEVPSESSAQGHLVAGDRVVAVDLVDCSDITEVIAALEKKKGQTGRAIGCGSADDATCRYRRSRRDCAEEYRGRLSDQAH